MATRNLFILIFGLALILPVTSYAHEDEVTATLNANLPVDTVQALEETHDVADAIVEEPGLLPDSPFYFLKQWAERLRVSFTSDADKKTELEQRFALKRLAEAEKLMEKGKTDKAQKHLEKFSSQMARFEDRLEDAKANSNGQDTEALVEKLKLLQERQQDVLERVYAQVPEQAQDAILNAMEQSSKGLGRAIERLRSREDAQELLDTMKQKFDEDGATMRVKIKEQLEARGVFDRGDEETEDKPESEDSDADGDEGEAEDNPTNTVNSNKNSNTNEEESEDEDEPEVKDDDSENSGSENSNVNTPPDAY